MGNNWKGGLGGLMSGFSSTFFPQMHENQRRAWGCGGIFD